MESQFCIRSWFLTDGDRVSLQPTKLGLKTIEIAVFLELMQE